MKQKYTKIIDDLLANMMVEIGRIEVQTVNDFEDPVQRARIYDKLLAEEIAKLKLQLEALL